MTCSCGLVLSVLRAHASIHISNILPEGLSSPVAVSCCHLLCRPATQLKLDFSATQIGDAALLALLPAGPAGSTTTAGCMPPLFKLTAAAMLRSKAASQPSASQVGASSCRSSPCQSAVYVPEGPQHSTAECVISSACSRTTSEKLLVSSGHSKAS